MALRFFFRNPHTALLLAFGLFLLLQSCSKSEEKTAPPLPPPPPTTGSVEARFLRHNSDKPVPALLVYLCVLDIGGKCTLRSPLSGTTDSNGVLRVAGVPPGSYAFVLADPSFAEKTTDGFLFEYTSSGVSMMPGATAEVASDGTLLYSGFLRHSKSGLRVVLHRNEFSKVDVRIGETASADVEIPTAPKP